MKINNMYLYEITTCEESIKNDFVLSIQFSDKKDCCVIVLENEKEYYDSLIKKLFNCSELYVEFEELMEDKNGK